ncbi:NRDE family protein [Microbacterium halotolerans]|uniref:NRDE family protein n=1 Tax=Microbacterium halotolerans TaxID=246613 RepID=UPI000E6A9ADC|nr:NRDE family protein [Microbacterium halotolerans]
MCTVVIRVPETVGTPISLLAVRDEDPARPWNPLGRWWPDDPDVAGVQDRLAGGAWLAAGRGRLAVTLNRHGEPDLSPERIVSRGSLALDAAAGRPQPAPHAMRGFNLVSVAEGAARVTSWDGDRMTQEEIGPGTHMLAHHDLDDPRSERIAAWREGFAEVELGVGEDWYQPWIRLLERTTEVGPTDDRAIVRDNRPLGYPTLSTLACVARIGSGAVDVRYAEFDAPGEWSPLLFA